MQLCHLHLITRNNREAGASMLRRSGIYDRGYGMVGSSFYAEMLELAEAACEASTDFAK
jgi:hypothetical protein